MTQNLKINTSVSQPVLSTVSSFRQVPSPILSTKGLFSHFFLIHDFLFRMVKSPSGSGKFFDLQIQVDEKMRKAAKFGGKIGQGGTFAALIVYCLKGRSIKLRLLYGFLYMYWIDHFYTLGSYLGILLSMPSVYKKTGEYFLTNQPLNEKNLFLRLNQQMNKNEDYEDTQQILSRIFNQQVIEQKNYVVNQFFTKNKQKYFTAAEGTLVERPTIKLQYLDCFLTRYVYYTFTRWYTRRLTAWGLIKGDF